MIDYFIEIKTASILNNTMCLIMEGYVFNCPEYTKPKLVVHFSNDKEGRYMPMVMQEIEHKGETCRFAGLYDFRLDKVFWDTQKSEETIEVKFDLLVCNELMCNINVYFNSKNTTCESGRFSLSGSRDGHLIIHQGELIDNASLKQKAAKVVSSLLGRNSREIDDFYADKKGREANVTWKNSKIKKFIIGVKRAYTMGCYEIWARKSINKSQVSILSQRSTDLIDNELFIYNMLKERKDVTLRTSLSITPYEKQSLIALAKFAKLCAGSKVLVVDEYVPALYFLHIRKETRIIQVWHACGAFKTVGFSRLGKPDAPIQSRRAHRNYDYSIVSSSEICRWYAEAFGLSPEKVIPLGVPRTDIFFSEEYAALIRAKLYHEYPELEGKKVILFAPTFRGGTKSYAYYPFELFDVKEIMDALGDDYVMIMKHHPFVTEEHPIPVEYADRVLDLWDYPAVNDLLFVTDILISDYSSVIFEASLLNIPMLFYGFDLDEYIATRDFYYEFRDFVPGKIVVSQDEIIESIKNEDFQQEKVEAFKNRFFEYTDGRSTERVCDLITSLMDEA